MANWLRKQKTANLSQGRCRFTPDTGPVCPGHRSAQNAYHPPNNLWEINSENLQNCSCIQKRSQLFWRLQMHIEQNPKTDTEQLQLHKEHDCLRAESCNCIFLNIPRIIYSWLHRFSGGWCVYCCLVPFGGVPTTPDPNTSAKVSRYKWEPYRDTNWWCIYYFLPRGGHTLAKVCHRNGRCIAILFKSIGVRGRSDSPDPSPS